MIYWRQPRPPPVYCEGEHEGAPGGPDVAAPRPAEKAPSPQRGREDAPLASLPRLDTETVDRRLVGIIVPDHGMGVQ
jgi:hypothetical protein